MFCVEHSNVFLYVRISAGTMRNHTQHWKLHKSNVYCHCSTDVKRSISRATSSVAAANQTNGIKAPSSFFTRSVIFCTCCAFQFRKLLRRTTRNYLPMHKPMPIETLRPKHIENHCDKSIPRLHSRHSMTYPTDMRRQSRHTQTHTQNNTDRRRETRETHNEYACSSNTERACESLGLGNILTTSQQRTRAAPHYYKPWLQHKTGNNNNNNEHS